MPSRLSSLLVRDGLVGVKRMEKAYQRQVIYGGSLDTILLEMNLLPEERLTQYLALASGLPPAARDEGAAIEPAALELLDKEIAEQFRAVPLSLAPDGDALRILVCAPLELSELDDNPTTPTQIKADVGIGEVKVIVPSNLTVEVRSSVGVGDISRLQRDGTFETDPFAGDDNRDHRDVSTVETIGEGDPDVVVTAHVGIGQILIGKE